jgi:hypothetical protein
MAHREFDIVKKSNSGKGKIEARSTLDEARPDLSKPLLDSEWLLGPKVPTRSPTKFVAVSVFLAASIMVVIFASPTLIRSWLHFQLASQFRNGQTSDIRHDGLVGLAKLLPDSLEQIIDGLSKADQSEALLAFRVLNEYLDNLDSLPIEERRARFAETAYALEKQLATISPTTANMVGILASTIKRNLSNDLHPGAAITLATCDQLIETVDRQSTRSKSKRIAASTANLSDRTNGSASLSDSSPAANSRNSDRRAHEVEGTTGSKNSRDQSAPNVLVSAKLTDEPESIQNKIADAPKQAASWNPETPTIATKTYPSQRPLKFYPVDSIVSESALKKSSPLNLEEFSSLRQKLQTANRFMPVSGSISVPIESAESIPQKRNEDEVIGIDRQKTEDLLRLLTSVQPRVATAAFHELERNRLNREELEIAVELARGTSSQRLNAMEKLATNPRIDPMVWLSWMANDSDRAVRYKAVSLIGSLNNEEAQSQLRTLSSRERDQEISQHIQYALQAQGAPLSTKR